MSEIAPFDNSKLVETSAGSFDPAQRQAELTAQGRGMVEALTRGVPDMLRGGIVRETTKPSDRATGVKRYSTTPSSPADYAGGWREVTVDGRHRLISVTITVPDGTRTDVERVAEIELANPKLIGTSKLPGTPQSIRAVIDRQDVAHVSGRRDALPFNVDYPNPRSLRADLDIAGTTLGEAARGLAALEASISPAPTELPQPPAIPAPISGIIEPPRL